jgi:zinc protease
LWKNGIDEETLESAKAYVKGQFPPRYETSSQLAGLLVQMQLYGYDESFINTFETKVNNLDVGETKRLIDTYFPRENMQMVIVGNAGEIREGLGKYGAMHEVDIKANGFDFD